ncbi:MAG: hypothetical protein KDF65_07795 [Anaerolineae bacterium]|nr:hypothetical protein [Anaerolineae bacterium]
MTTALMNSSQIGVTLSLTVVKDNQVMTLPLANLTPILLWLWSLWQGVNALVISTATHAARLAFSIERQYARLLSWLLPPAYMPVGVG